MNDPFILLPSNLAGLADLTADSSRFSLSAVKLSVKEDSYKAVATDGRALALVEGEMTADPLDYPTLTALAEAPDPAAEALIPAGVWKEAFRAVPKGPAVRDNPALGHVAVHAGPQQSILATTDGESEQVRQTANLEGRFPDYKAVLPKGPPQARVVVDPRLLLELVKLASRMVDPDNARLVLELRDPRTPIVLRTSTETQEFTGLLMPLLEGGPRG